MKTTKQSCVVSVEVRGHRNPVMVVQGEDNATAVAAFLVHRSASFELTPLDDDQWRISYKPENHAAVLEEFGAPAILDAHTVIVGVHGGCVQWVQKGDPKIRVFVRDYDTDGCDADGLHRDVAGDLYVEWME